jgi:CubicO group peptidase (beta-lactamase class C family)
MIAAMRVVVAVLAVLACSSLHGQDLRGIDAWMKEEMRAHLVPGAAMVITDASSIVHSGAWGKSGNGDSPVTIDTPFVIGSLSKMFTATAVLQLVEQGRVELDAPVQRYLPWFRVADAELSKKITVRHLLNQTSGLPTLAPRARGARPLLEDHVRALAAAELSSMPGRRHIYSSPNYLVAGLIVEKVSGVSFGTYLQRSIFAPLGMTRTFVTENEARGAGLARGHNIWFGMALPSSYEPEADRLPTASIITTARDLSRFAAAHLGGGALGSARILSPALTALSHKGAAPAGGFSYAMGFREGETAGAPSLWHGGSLPSYRGAVVLLPQKGRAIVVLTNSSSMFADHSREMAGGIAAILDGREPVRMYRPLKSTYTFIAIGAALLLLLQVRSMVRAARTAKSAHRTVIATTLIFDFGIPLLAFFLVPRLTKISWKGMYEGAPDLVALIALLLTLAVITGVIKVIQSRKERGRGAAASAEVTA